MKILIFFLIILTGLLSIIIAQDQDLVKNIPDYPYKGKMYSGYLTLNNAKKQLHYLFIESEGDSSKKPLVLWMNGGPGCSSMLGWAQEHGPASFGEETNKFKINPYSWHKLANIIYLEAPAGVGYSVLNSDFESDKFVSDFTTAKENLEALIQFFQRFPNMKNNDLYISGESYAGIYVPTLTSNILDYNTQQVSSKKINLKGFIVGNGVTDWNVDTGPAFMDFAYTHGLYSTELRTTYLASCVTTFDDVKCTAIKTKLDTLFENSGINIYDIYRKCFKPQVSNLSTRKSYNYTPWLFNPEFGTQSNNNFLSYLSNSRNFRQTPPCVDSYGPDEFFNRKDVKAAFNVNSDILWQMCSDNVGERYQRDMRGSFYLYPKLLNSGLKILIYSGDTDGAVPYNGTQKWINNLALPVLKPWKSWRVNNSNVAGYRTVYQGLTFATIKGVGHMVPQWKPEETFYMLTQFLNGADL